MNVNENAREKLKSCLLEVVERDIKRAQQEAEASEPFLVSKEFEEKMQALMQVKPRKKKWTRVVSYAAAALVTMVLAGGILVMRTQETQASLVGIDILEWLENFFVVENKSEDTEADGQLFDESRIGYLPEGFEKVEEEVTFSYVYYKYQNETGKYITLQVCRDKLAAIVDNEEINHEVSLNVMGLEYQYIYKAVSKENVVTWKDKENIYFYIISTLDKEEVTKIMNGISY